MLLIRTWTVSCPAHAHSPGLSAPPPTPGGAWVSRGNIPKGVEVRAFGENTYKVMYGPDGFMTTCLENRDLTDGGIYAFCISKDAHRSPCTWFWIFVSVHLGKESRRCCQFPYMAIPIGSVPGALLGSATGSCTKDTPTSGNDPGRTVLPTRLETVLSAMTTEICIRVYIS